MSNWKIDLYVVKKRPFVPESVLTIYQAMLVEDFLTGDLAILFSSGGISDNL